MTKDSKRVDPAKGLSFPRSDPTAAVVRERNDAGAEARDGLHFTRLRLGYWRNFKQVDVELRPRVFLVGPNASGKSNLLDAFRFLRDVASSSVGFTTAVDGLRSGVDKIRCLAATRNTTVTVGVDVGTDDLRETWSYELGFDADASAVPVVKKEVVRRRGEVLLERPDEQDREDPLRLRQPYIQQLTVNKDFRPLAEFLQSVRYLHLVPQLVRDSNRSPGRKDDPFGGDFLDQLASKGSRERDARLKRIQKALSIVVPQLDKLRFTDKGPGSRHLEARYEHWRPRGSWQDEVQLSDGTLRLVGLLWALLEGDGPLLLKEPELSLHSAIIRVLPLLFSSIQSRGGRQIIVSTHSPELLAEEGIGLDEVLILKPAAEGTHVRQSKSLSEVTRLVSAGIPLPDVLQANTAPSNPVQLLLFADGNGASQPAG